MMRVMRMQEQELYDVIIIGGGPGGMAAAQYAARARLKTLVIDKNPMAGALGKASRIENYPGVQEPVPGPELLGIMRKQAEDFGAVAIMSQVQGVNLKAEPKEIMTNDAVYRSKTVIIATGSMGRKSTLPGEAEFLGSGVSYCATCDAPFFKGKDVAVVGELPVLMEELSAVARFAGTVYIVSKSRDISQEHERVIDSDPNIKLFLNHNLKEITGEDIVTKIKIADSTNEERELDVDGVFMYLAGARPVVDFLLGAVELNDEGCINVDQMDMSTSLEGVYAIGDVTCKRIRQVVVATAEGCIAALSADKYINDRTRVMAQWGNK
jgi:thioredoxin reductase (NADPH)